MTTNPASFHSLVGRLATDGGELLRRLAVEHEREVAHLHSEISRLQETIAHFTGAPPPEVKLYPGAEALSAGDDVEVTVDFSSNSENSVPLRKGLEGKVLSVSQEGDACIDFANIGVLQWVFPPNFSNLIITSNASKVDSKTRRSNPHSMSSQEQQRGRQAARKGVSGAGKPDENALAKAFAFVDSIDISTALEGQETPLEVEDTATVMKIAEDIAGFARQHHNSSAELDRKAPRSMGPSSPQLTGPGGPPLVPPVPVRHLPESGRDFRPPTDCREQLNGPYTPETTGTDFGYSDLYAVQDPTGQSGIKLSSISPPVKAPGRLPEPPALPDDDLDDIPLVTTTRNEETEILSERLKLPRDSTGPAAAAAVESLARRSPAIDLLPLREEAQAPSGQDAAAAATSRSVEEDGHRTDLDASVDGMKTVPVFLKSVSKPETESLSLSEPRFQDSLEGRFQDAGRSPMQLGESQAFPSRETTTWDPLQDAARELLEESESPVLSTRPLDPESPVTPPAEALRSSKRAEASRMPPEDWRALLQVHGSRWRPSGDDGVGIAMYLDTPSASSQAVNTKADGAPTSI